MTSVSRSTTNFHWLLTVISIKGHTHRWRQIHIRSCQQTCFPFFMPQKSFNKPFEFLLFKTNRLHFSMCVYCNRSQKMSQHVKNNSLSCHLTPSHVILFCPLHAVTSSVIYYSTHTWKNVIYLLNNHHIYSMYSTLSQATHLCLLRSTLWTRSQTAAKGLCHHCTPTDLTNRTQQNSAGKMESSFVSSSASFFLSFLVTSSQET